MRRSLLESPIEGEVISGGLEMHPAAVARSTLATAARYAASRGNEQEEQNPAARTSRAASREASCASACDLAG
jgi:hypothetical protein